MRPSFVIKSLYSLNFVLNSYAVDCVKRFSREKTLAFLSDNFLIAGRSKSSAKLITSTALMARITHLRASLSV